MSNTRESLDIPGLLSTDTPARQKWKLGLRAFSIAVAAVPLGYAAYFTNAIPGGDFFNQFLLASAVISIAWNLAELILFSINKRGFHPGAQVGGNLIVGILVVIATVFYILEYTFRHDRMSSYRNYHNKVYLKEFQMWDSHGPVVMAFCGLLIALHLTLFVWSCVDVHRMRMKRHVLLKEVLEAHRNAST